MFEQENFRKWPGRSARRHADHFGTEFIRKIAYRMKSVQRVCLHLGKNPIKVGCALADQRLPPASVEPARLVFGRRCAIIQKHKAFNLIVCKYQVKQSLKKERDSKLSKFLVAYLVAYSPRYWFIETFQTNFCGPRAKKSF